MNSCSACIANLDGDCADLGAVPQFVSYPASCSATIPSLISIEVAPGASGLNVGQSQPLTATGTFSDGSTQDLTALVTWASSDTVVATISNAAGSEGIATGVQAGTTTITAELGTAIGSTLLTVNP